MDCIDCIDIRAVIQSDDNNNFQETDDRVFLSLSLSQWIFEFKGFQCVAMFVVCVVWR